MIISEASLLSLCCVSIWDGRGQIASLHKSRKINVNRSCWISAASFVIHNFHQQTTERERPWAPSRWSGSPRTSQSDCYCCSGQFWRSRRPRAEGSLQGRKKSSSNSNLNRKLMREAEATSPSTILSSMSWPVPYEVVRYLQAQHIINTWEHAIRLSF